MRRLILSLFCLVICSYAIADSVTPQQAAKKAETFFSGGIRTKSGSSVKLVWTWPEVQTKASNGADPLLYVFEREGGGFAIVAGEDAAHPILGYSDTGSFSTTDMPDNLRSFLSWYGEVLQCARDNHWSASPEMRKEWNRGMTLADLDNEQSVQLETAQWGQWSPYNDLCPVIDGKRCPSGCVATATAIIMRYHQWPKRGTGELPSYDYDIDGVKGHVEGYSLGHEYQWDKMPMKMPEGGYTEEQSQQISQLLYDVGVMAQMCFSPFASGAINVSAGRGLIKYFDYDADMHSLSTDQNMISLIDIERTIQDELTNLRPVLYDANPSAGVGHALVIDGYRDSYFSFNFGWDGTVNGYYRITPIEGHENELSLYYKIPQIYYNICPNAGGVYAPNNYSYSIKDERGFLFDWDFRSNLFSFRGQLIRGGDGVQDYNIEFRIGHYDSSGKLVEIVGGPTSINWSASNVLLSIKDCHIDEPLYDGDQLILSYRIQGDDEWRSNYVCNPNEERSQGLVGPCRLADPREVFHMK